MDEKRGSLQSLKGKSCSMAFTDYYSSHTTTEAVYERAKIPRPAHLLATRIVQFNHRILSGPPQAAQSVLKWNPKLKRSRPAGRQSYKNLLYYTTSPLPKKLTPDSRSQRVGHLLSHLKSKSFVAARIKAIPLNLPILEQLQQQEDQLPL